MADEYQKKIDLGIFTAYGEAVNAGYEGTKEEFEAGLVASASYADNAQASAEAAAASETAAETAQGKAEDAQEAAETAQGKAEDAQTAAEAAQAAAETAALTLTIDPTLTQSGQAADAKVTGDAIGTNDAILSLADEVDLPTTVAETDKYIDNSDGSGVSNTLYCTTVLVPVSRFSSVKYSRACVTTGSTHAAAIAFYDASQQFISCVNAKTGQAARSYEDATVSSFPEGTAYVAMSVFKSTSPGTPYLKGVPKLSALSEDVAALDSASTEQAAAIASNTEAIAGNAANISDLQDENSAQTGRIVTLEENAETQASAVSALQDIAVAQAESLASLGETSSSHTTQIAALDSGKVDKVQGKGLSQNDYTDTDKAALDNIKTTDTTLLVSGKAADAKTVGEALTVTDSILALADELDLPITVAATGKFISNETGEPSGTGTDYNATALIPTNLFSGVKYSRVCVTTGSTHVAAIAFYDASQQFISCVNAKTGQAARSYEDATVSSFPDGTAYVAMSIFKSTSPGTPYLRGIPKVSAYISALTEKSTEYDDLLHVKLQFENWTDPSLGKYASPSVADSESTTVNTSRSSESSNRQYSVMACAGGDKFIITATGTSNLGPRAYIFADTNGKTNTRSAAWCAPINTSYNQQEITAPDGAAYVYINRVYTDGIANSYKIISLKQYTEQLIKPINAGLTVVSMGDSIFGSFRATSGANESISHMVAVETGMNCLNYAFGATHAKEMTGARHVMDFEPLADAIASGDFTDQLAYAESRTDDPEYITRVTELSRLDFSTVDIITISYGTNDWHSNVTTADYAAALEYGIRTIAAAYPQIRFLVCTPIIRFKRADDPDPDEESGESTGEGDIIDSDSDNFVNGNGVKLSAFAEQAELVAHKLHAQPCENYWTLGITVYNTSIYMGGNSAADLTHPNAKGRRLIAHHVIDALNRM